MFKGEVKIFGWKFLGTKRPLADLSSALLLRYAYWSFIRCKLVSSTRVKQVPGSNCFAESCSCFQETSTSLPVPRARFRLHSFNAAGSVRDFREDLAQAHSICRRTWVVAWLVNLAQHSGQCGRISAPDFKKKNPERMKPLPESNGRSQQETSLSGSQEMTAVN